MTAIVLSGNANWSTCNAGGPPAAGDSIYLNTFILTLDGVDGATYTCVLIRASVSDIDVATTSGTIAFGVDTTACALDCELIGGVRGPMLTVPAGKCVTIGKPITLWALAIACLWRVAAFIFIKFSSQWQR